MTNPNGRFCKTEECPASEELVAFQRGVVPLAAGEVIWDHLIECEFCDAEVEFYRQFPPVDESVPAGKIPKPLFELADALLKKERDLSPLYRLIGD
jgi:hypothetical protein